MKVTVPESFAPPTIPPFVYKASITAIETKVASTGSLMVTCEYTLLSEGNDPTQTTTGRKLFDNLVLSDAALWRANATVKAATGSNIPKGDYEVDELAGIISNLLLNKEVMVRTDNEKIKRDGVLTDDLRSVIKEVKAIA